MAAILQRANFSTHGFAQCRHRWNANRKLSDQNETTVAVCYRGSVLPTTYCYDFLHEECRGSPSR